MELYKTNLISDANIKGNWRFEDNTTDSSSNGNTLTNNGSASYTIGKFNKGIDFGTASKWVSIASNLGIAGNGDVSYGFWFKLNAEITSGSWYMAVHYSTTTADRYLAIFYEYNGGTRRIGVDSSASNGTYNVTIGTSDWHHVVVTRNSSGASLYFDGVSVVSNQAQGTYAPGKNVFTIGAADGGGNQSSIIIDDAFVFNRILTDDEILLFYNNPPTSISGGSFLINFL